MSRRGTIAAEIAAQKKDYATADKEFTKALESEPKSAELIYDIGDYAVKRSQPDKLLAVASAGERVAPGDPRRRFYRGVALVLKKEDPGEAERLLRSTRKKRRCGRDIRGQRPLMPGWGNSTKMRTGWKMR